MRRLQVGSSDVEIPAIGLGCMGMSEFYGPADRGECERTLAAALDLGAVHFDTADMYGYGANETLLGEFLAAAGRRARAVLATKFGILRDPSDPHARALDTRPAYVAKACEASLARLRTDRIDIYYAHRLSPDVPVEETVGAMARLVAAGKVRALGLSEVSGDTLRRAHAVHPIAAVQSEYSLWSRDVEDDVLPVCRELGTAFVAYSPLGRGQLAGLAGGALAADDFRRRLPRFAEGNLARNERLARALGDLGASLGCTQAQLALAWAIAQPGVAAIPGTRKLARLRENVAAAALSPTPEMLAQIGALMAAEQVAGARYGNATSLAAR